MYKEPNLCQDKILGQKSQKWRSEGREASESEDDTEEIKDDPRTDTARNVAGTNDVS